MLVVEDNVEVGRFCTQILMDLGYSTEWAANAEEALDRLGAADNGFEVVFSDVLMPGMGGIALAKVLRRRLPNLPVILASGYSQALADDGAKGFVLLHMPYSAEQLSKALRERRCPGSHGTVPELDPGVGDAPGFIPGACKHPKGQATGVRAGCDGVPRPIPMQDQAAALGI